MPGRPSRESRRSASGAPAAGVLGANPPAPLKANSLAQTVLWDGSFGKPIVAAGLKPTGPFEARVAPGPVVALATGPKGEVYLFHGDPTGNSNMGGNKLKVIDRNGKPLEVLMPMSADLPPARLEALGVFRTESGQLVPRLHNYEQLGFYPDPLGSRGQSMPAYASPTVDARGRIYWLMLGVRLACLDKDGGVPYPTLYSEPLLPDLKGLPMTHRYAHGFDRPSLAVSGGGRWIYFAGLQRGKGPRGAKPVPAVFRVQVVDTNNNRLTTFGRYGNEDFHTKEQGQIPLVWPTAVAVSDTHVYVGETLNRRVVRVKLNHAAEETVPLP